MAARPTVLITFWYERIAARLRREETAVFQLGKDYGTSDMVFIRDVLPDVMAPHGLLVSLSPDERLLIVTPTARPTFASSDAASPPSSGDA